jgi:hypothetical protein
MICHSRWFSFVIIQKKLGHPMLCTYGLMWQLRQKGEEGPRDKKVKNLGQIGFGL